MSTGDDCIAVKSGKNLDGRLVGIPTNNVTIRNMIFGQGHGISLGSEMSGNITNVHFHNLTQDGTENGVRVKSCPGRGGVIRDILYEDMVIKVISTPCRDVL